jgi:hypothetical protein
MNTPPVVARRSTGIPETPWPGLSRPSTAWWLSKVPGFKTWMPGTSPGKGILVRRIGGEMDQPEPGEIIGRAAGKAP